MLGQVRIKRGKISVEGMSSRNRKEDELQIAQRGYNLEEYRDHFVFISKFCVRQNYKKKSNFA